jgi:hypothetical protein
MASVSVHLCRQTTSHAVIRPPVLTSSPNLLAGVANPTLGFHTNPHRYNPDGLLRHTPLQRVRY